MPALRPGPATAGSREDGDVHLRHDGLAQGRSPYAWDDAALLQSCVEHWSIEDDDVVIMPSPVTHITGYSWGLEMPFYHGTRSLLMERWDAGEAVELIDRHGARATIGATPFLQELVDAAERKGSRLLSLKVFACGGAAVPPALVQRANALFAKGRTFRVYGSTEAPMTTLDRERWNARPRSRDRWTHRRLRGPHRRRGRNPFPRVGRAKS